MIVNHSMFLIMYLLWRVLISRQHGPKRVFWLQLDLLSEIFVTYSQLVPEIGGTNYAVVYIDMSCFLAIFGYNNSVHADVMLLTNMHMNIVAAQLYPGNNLLCGFE